MEIQLRLFIMERQILMEKFAHLRLVELVDLNFMHIFLLRV